MSVSDWVSIVSSVVSAIAAVIAVGLSVFVYVQNQKHECKIDSRDEVRHNAAIVQCMNEFLFQFHSELPYLPLAYMAILYDSDRIYVRSLYSMLHVQNIEVQKLIAEKFSLSVLTESNKDIYDICYQKALTLFAEKGAADGRSNMMYDFGKYWKMTMTCYGSNPLISDYFDVENFITEVLSGQLITLEEQQKSLMLFKTVVNPAYSILDNELEMAQIQPIQYIIDKLGLKECDENRCCQCMSIIIYWLAEYHDGQFELSMSDLDDRWLENDDKIAEDLFLKSMLAVYRLVLSDQKGNGDNG